MNRHRLLNSMLAVALIASTALLISISTIGRQPAASAQTNPIAEVRVSIERITATGDLEPFGTEDFYAIVTIDGEETETSFVKDDADVSGDEVPDDWTISQPVDLSESTIPIVIGVYDADGIIRFDDGHADIVSTEGKNLNLTVHLLPCSVSGDLDRDCAQTIRSEGTGRYRAAIEFRIDVILTGDDADGDGLFDVWEESGVDADGDGVIDVDLPKLNADPQRADVFVEIDCLVSDGDNNGRLTDPDDHSHCPRQDAIEDVVQAFANAPVGNPDGTSGIQLHLDTGPLYGAEIVHSIDGSDGVTGTYGDLGGGGDQIPEAGNEIVDWDGATGLAGTSFYTLKADNFNAGRALVFRYSLFVHQTNVRRATNDCTSGAAEGIAGNDFFVSLGGVNTIGNPCWSTDANGFSIGSQAEQAGTFMHELGHALGLRHGGGDSVHLKPNYLSVMSYAFQRCMVTAGPIGANTPLPGGCDYSRDELEELVEDIPPGLDECQGIDAGLYGLGAVDFNADGTFQGTSGCNPLNTQNVSVDINNDGDANDTHEGFDDWANLRFEFQTLENFANGVASPVQDEATPNDIEEAEEFMDDLLAPDLAITKSDSEDPAVAGEELTYTLTVTNNGPTAADEVEVVDTLPASVSYVSDDAGCSADGGVVSCDLGQVPVQDSEDVTITVLIDAGLVAEHEDAAVITNTASVANLDENADESITDNNSVTEETQVVAEADLEIASFKAAQPEREIAIGEPAEVTLEKVVTNNGPSGPIDAEVDVSAAVLSSADGGVGVEPDPANPGEVAALDVDEQRSIVETFTISCLEPGTYTVTFTNTIAPLNPDDTDPDTSNNEARTQVTVTCAVPVAINIQPSGSPNAINVNSQNGAIPLAVLTTDVGEYGLPVALDASEIDPRSVRFGPADLVFDSVTPGGATEVHDRGHLEDSYELDEETRDGDLDMVLHFSTAETGLEADDTEACVTGTYTTVDDETLTFFGCDAIVTRP